MFGLSGKINETKGSRQEMKEIKDYVCTLEQAKKLHLLKINEYSFYVWSEQLMTVIDGSPWAPILSKNQEKDCELADGYYHAYTSQELGDMIFNMSILCQSTGNIKLAEFIQRRHTEVYDFAIDAGYKRKYSSTGWFSLDNVNSGYTEAQTRAEFLIYLLTDCFYAVEYCDLCKIKLNNVVRFPIPMLNTLHLPVLCEQCELSKNLS